MNNEILPFGQSFLDITRRDIITDVYTYLDERINESRVRGTDTAHMSENEIKTFTDCLLCSGPNNNTTIKLRQLNRLIALHDAYESGHRPKCLMSVYLPHLENIENIRRMKDDIENGRLVVLQRHLKNVPLGWIVLADRGFAYDCFKYPHMNKHITPHFVNKRAQFEREELDKDIPSCRSRYISEAIFSRMTDVVSLQDVIPYHYLTYLDFIINYAKGRANLQQPFYIPPGYPGYK